MAPGIRRLDDPRVADLGANLREIREELELTQEELAARSGVQAGEISRIERGQRDPRVSTVLKLAKALRLPPARLLD